MSWGRIDDGLHDNDKWVELSLAARGLWTTAYSWTCRHRKPVVTDGLLRMFAGGDATDLANEMVSVGMWHKPGHGCARCPEIDRGYVFHDWADYQEKSVSEKRAEAGRKGGRAGRGEAKARRKQTDKQTDLLADRPDLLADSGGPGPAKSASDDASKPGDETGSDQREHKQTRKQTASKRASRYPEPVPEPVPVPEHQNPSSTDVDPLTGFDAFWDVWPQRGGRRVGKAKAQERWRKLGIDDRRAAFRGARHYAAASDAGHQGAMDAWRWLRDQLWVDFQEPPTPTARGRPAHAASDASDADRHDPTRWD